MAIVAGVAFSPDRQQALSASSDGSMRLWNLDTSECLQVLKYTEERDFFFEVAFHHNGYQILVPGGMKMRVLALRQHDPHGHWKRAEIVRCHKWLFVGDFLNSMANCIR